MVIVDLIDEKREKNHILYLLELRIILALFFCLHNLQFVIAFNLLVKMTKKKLCDDLCFV